jgi:putative transposase
MRKPRELQAGARYHVTARANRKEMILDDPSMKELFLSVLKRAKIKYDFRIENFCIMGNHFHFIIQPLGKESLSSIMQWIMSVFAMAFNRIMGYTGHVWGSRFFSRIIPSLRGYTEVFEYIDRNPEKACQVLDRRDWVYGGLGHDRRGCRDIVEPKKDWIYFFFPEHFQLQLLC